MKSVSLVSCVFLSSRPFCWRVRQTHLREQENEEQHVTDRRTTVDSMLRLHRTLAFFFWYFLLLHRQAVADEEAAWGSTVSSENPPENKASSSWWPKLPSLPKLPFSIPFYGSSDSKDEVAAVTTAAKGLTESSDHISEDSGSGEGSIFEESPSPTALTQGLLTSVAKIRSESPPTGTSDSPHSSLFLSDNDTLVSDSYSSTSIPIRNTLFTNNPTSTDAPEQNATHTRPPRGTTRAAEPSTSATAQHLQEEHSDHQTNEDFSPGVYSTIAPETTVPTALTWATAQTMTPNPGLVETALTSRHTLGPATHPATPETIFITEPQDSSVSISLQTGEFATSDAHSTQSQTDLGFSELRFWATVEKQGVMSTAPGIDHKLVLESTTQTQKVNVSVGGKQS